MRAFSENTGIKQMAENTTEFVNCFTQPFRVRFSFGESPGVFISLLLLNILINMLAWILRKYKNSVPDMNINVNILLNMNIVEILNALAIVIVRS